MLKFLALCIVLLLLTAGAIRDSIVGKWGSHDGDFIEFAANGKAVSFNNRLNAAAVFNWEFAQEGELLFSHETKNKSNICKFTIREMALYDTITIYGCLMSTSQGIVNSWSGRKGIALAGE